ncbi:methyltransferase domain-containing protein [Gemmatimonadota bacterium]
MMESATNLDRLEIPSVALLDEERPLVDQFRAIAHRMHIEIGWHYLLDFSWSARQVSLTPGMRVIDAGAGWGVMQLWLAEQNIDVISVDRSSRSDLPNLLRQRYRVHGLRDEDLAPPARPGLRDLLPPLSPGRWHRYPSKLAVSIRALRPGRTGAVPGGGMIQIYNQDLASLPDIPDGSIDAIFSISALEHNSPEGLRGVVTELMRVLKPGGLLTATLGASRDEDWFHEPSQGWCYSEKTLRDIFDLAPDSPSNYDRYDELFEDLRGCDELRRALSPVYSRSADNGMPWGVWDPTYQPIGVVKQKKDSS